MNSKRQVYCKGETWSRGTNLRLTLDVTWCLTSLIDLFSLYVLFSQYRSCDNTLENCFCQISSCLRAYVRTKRQSVKFPCDLYWENKTYKLKRSIPRNPVQHGGTQQMFIRGGSALRTNPLPFIYHFNRCKFTVFQIRINHKIERFPTFSSHKIHLLALLGPFTDPNDRFPYPSIYFNKWNPWPFHIPEAWKRNPFRGVPPRLI